MIVEREERPRNDAVEDLNQVFQERITQAIQPVLDNFQNQLAQAVQRQVATSAGAGERRQEEESPAPNRKQEALPQQQEEPIPRQEHSPSDTKPPAESGKGEKPAPQSDNSGGSIFTHGIRRLLSFLLHTFEEEGEQWLRSMLHSSVDAIFSDQVRKTVEEQADLSLQTLLQEAFEGLPDSENGRKVQRETRQTLGTLLNDTLDSIFAGSVRADMERDIDLAIDRVVQGDFDEAPGYLKDAAESLVGGVFDILQDHWQQVLRILFKVVAQALQEAITSSIKEGLGGIATGADKSLEDKVEPLKEEVEEKSEELRERMSDVVATMRERVEEATEEMQQRLTSAVHEGTHNTKLGQHPALGRSRGSAPGRAPLGRPPSGRPPSGRPPSARRR